MRARGIRWPFLWAFLFSFCLWSMVHAATQTPLLPHKDPGEEREFQNVYQSISRAPSILSGSSGPSVVPNKTGDIFINTTTSKIYIATGTVSSGSWTVIN